MLGKHFLDSAYDYLIMCDDDIVLETSNKLYLENSLSNAYYVAYSKLERKIDISSSSIYAIYINEIII
jgi:PDZ domain-containing secreted protein